MANKRPRLRSLQSVLWDTESTDDPEELRKAWFGERPPSYKRVVPDLVAESSSDNLQEENAKLHTIIKNLKKQAQLSKPIKGDGYSCRVPKKLTNSALLQKLDRWHWLQNMDQQVAQLPRMVEEIVPSLESSNFCNDAISFDVQVGDSALVASSVLAQCQSTIEGFYARHPAIFKIGLTKSPVARWSNAAYGYAHDKYDKWSGMKVLFAHKEGLAAGLVEAALIQYFMSVPGCRNVNPGGEGVDQNCPGPYFTYVVFRVLVPPPK